VVPLQLKSAKHHGKYLHGQATDRLKRVPLPSKVGQLSLESRNTGVDSIDRQFDIHLFQMDNEGTCEGV
jgi:hypothetical protein